MLKKDLDVRSIKNNLAVVLINEHIYPPDVKKLKYYSKDSGWVEEWYSMRLNPLVIKSEGYNYVPSVDVNANSFEMKFKGTVLSYCSISKFNNFVTNIYLVYKLNLYKNVELPKYPLINALFVSIRADRKGSTDPEKWYYHEKGIAIDSSGSFSMGSQGLGRNVIIFGVDNKLSPHSVNRPHNFMVLGSANTQLVENINSIPERDLVINMTYPGNKFVLSIHYIWACSLFYANGALMTTFSDLYYSNKKDHIGFSLRCMTRDFSPAEELKIGLNGSAYEFSIDHKVITAEDINIFMHIL